MSRTEDRIEHVSDTALMVAACRALETGRLDGLVRDPFAEKLAGARGMGILRGINGWELMTFGIGVRTQFLDRLVSSTLAEQGIRTVLSLGAGLDTRPWRLDLPADLRWIEVDFPDVIGYKTGIMTGETPRCRREHRAADLTQPAERQAAFAAAGSDPGLLITEGLLMYLPAEVVRAIAQEAVALSGIRHWLLDAASIELAARMGMDSNQSIQSVRAPGHLEGEQLLELVRGQGWMQMVRRSYSRDAMEVAGGRIWAMIAKYLAASGGVAPPPATAESSGVYLFGRE